jgi:hypothetical protein
MGNLKRPILTTCIGLLAKNTRNGGEIGEIHPISMIFIKLAVSHSVLHQKKCSWMRFESRQ